MSFPKGFLWGCATSAVQIEGAPFEGGRTASIWDIFAQKEGKIYHGHIPNMACDGYHRFERDLDNLQNLGVNSYRMSISRSRVQLRGIGGNNPNRCDYIRDFLMQNRHILKLMNYETVGSIDTLSRIS